MTPHDEASDPNTPPERLAMLLQTHLTQVLANPAFSLLFVEDPQWLERGVSVAVLVRLLNEPTLPAFVVEHFCQSTQRPVRLQAQMHHTQGPPAVGWETEVARLLAELACPPEERALLLAEGLVPHWMLPYLPEPSVPPEPIPESHLTERYLSGLPEKVRGELAEKTRNKDALRFFAEDPDLLVRRKAAGNRHLPPEVLCQLAQEPGFDDVLSTNPATPTEALEQILARTSVGRQDKTIARLLTEHPNLTYEQAQRIEEHLGIPVARHLPPHVFLAQVRSQRLSHRHVLGRTDMPLWLKGEAVMVGCMAKGHNLPWFCGLLVTQSETWLKSSAEATAWFVRFAVAIHPLTPTELLQALTDDVNRYVRAAAQARLANPGWTFQPERAGA